MSSAGTVDESVTGSVFFLFIWARRRRPCASAPPALLVGAAGSAGLGRRADVWAAGGWATGAGDVLEGSNHMRGGGIGLGGILVIIGIILMLTVSFWLGLIVLLIGLVAFGGFARGRWY